MLDIVEATEEAKYSEILQDILQELKGVEILRLAYGPEEVDIDVLLENGKVFAYHYDEVDCTWWDKIQAIFVRDEMIDESVCYATLEHYAAAKERERRMATMPPLEPLSYA